MSSRRMPRTSFEASFKRAASSLRSEGIGDSRVGKRRRREVLCAVGRSSRAQPPPAAVGLRRPAEAVPVTQVDHCRRRGRVRGISCFNCNSGLGLLRVDPAGAHRAAEYLEGNAWKPTLVAPGVYRLPS
ncbi:endonuclease domain-containing protein [Streptomyces sp. NPDC058295]|uniref:endonuclease domain-containing protein n=1 Tax=Streptomyces sp. NPDC058295 TaxID=3346431 RepID=UPI0036E0EA06